MKVIEMNKITKPTIIKKGYMDYEITVRELIKALKKVLGSENKGTIIIE